jgi:hypothetical protein
LEALAGRQAERWERALSLLGKAVDQTRGIEQTCRLLAELLNIMRDVH